MTNPSETTKSGKTPALPRSLPAPAGGGSTRAIPTKRPPHPFFVDSYSVEAHYHISVLIGYWIECSEPPGCASQGDTVEEALEMIRDAIKGHLEIHEEDKQGERKKRALRPA